MSTFVFANNVNTTLAAPITSTSQTHITLASSANLPTLTSGEIFAVTLNDAATQSVYEIVYATAISGAVLTVERGQEGTAAATWLSGDYAYASVTAGILETFIESIEAGSGITVTGGSGPTPTVANTGILGLTAGTGIEITGPTQSPTISSSGGVTSVSAGTGISITGSSSSPEITNTGVISISAGTGISVGMGSGDTPTISNAGVLAVNGLTGNVTGIVEQVTSNDGSVTVIAHSSGMSYDISIAQTGGYAAGNVQYRLRYNYTSSSPSEMIASNDGTGNQNSIHPLGSLLGVTPQNTGAVNSTIESVFAVVPIGTQTIGGSCNQSGGYVAVFVNGTLIASQTSPTGSFTWSTTISAAATVVLHVNDSASSGVNCIWSAWLPQNAYGGLDTTKFSSVTPGA